jgi:hypothetical protein
LCRKGRPKKAFRANPAQGQHIYYYWAFINWAWAVFIAQKKTCIKHYYLLVYLKNKKIPTKKHGIKKYTILIGCLLTSTIVSAQSKKLQLAARLVLQKEFQRAGFTELRFPFLYKEHYATQLNFGLDVMLKKNLAKKMELNFGLGFFNQRFNFRRLFDYYELNSAIDSSGLGVSTKYYTYKLLRLPIGVNYIISNKKGLKIQLGLENIIAFKISEVYQAPAPLPVTIIKKNNFAFFNNGIMFNAVFTKQIKNNQFSVAPFTRLANFTQIYNPILFETRQQLQVNYFDAFGINILYTKQF